MDCPRHPANPMRTTLFTRQYPWLGFCVVFALGFVACAPSTRPSANTPLSPTITTGETQRSADFYPSRSGLSWTYLREAESASTPTYELKVTGPVIWRGLRATAFRFFGRGQEFTYYRQVSTQGVKLLGIEAPGVFAYMYNPPILEYPAEEMLKQGMTWQGESQVTLEEFGHPTQVRTLTYTYRVLDRELVRIGAGPSYDAFVINLETRISGEPIYQTIRFAPGVGEIRTKEGLVLVGQTF